MKSISWSLLLCATLSGADEAPVEKMQPQLRAVDRDWAYFAELPCARAKTEPTHSAAEQRLLQQRQQQCMEKYKAFMSGGASR
jgi:hypothetical protein